MDHGKAEDMGMENTAGAPAGGTLASESAEVHEEEAAAGEAAYNQAWAEEHGLHLIGGTNRNIRLLQTRRRCVVFSVGY